jgi:hypothetical protein
MGTASYSTHSSSSAHVTVNKPALVRAAPPQPSVSQSDHYGYENPTAQGPILGMGDDKMYSSYASTRSYNNHLVGSFSPAINPSSAKKLPNYDKVVLLQMELLQLGRYEEAEKLSLQFSADDLSIDQVDGLLFDIHSRGQVSNQFVSSNRGTKVITSPHHDGEDPLAANHHLESSAQPVVHRAEQSRVTRAAAPPALPPTNASGALHATGFSAIGEAKVQVLGPYQPQQHRAPLQILDLQDQESPGPHSIDSTPVQALARTRSTEPPMHEKLALENKLASLAAVQKTPIRTVGPKEAWTMRVNVIQANAVPWKKGADECCCCLSLLQASANISSRSFHSICHVQAGQNISPLAVVDGALEITAMDRTSLSDTEQRTRFNETLCLTEMHPAAVHLAGDALPSAHELVAQGADHSLFRLGFGLNSA